MKPSRLNRVLGVAIGERSLLAAEIVVTERPELKRTAEFVYPEGITTQQPDQLGAALGEFLKENKFTAKSAVFGLPARWLLVKAKDVPPTDNATLTNLLRLQAEGEFSSELKDLVYDYTADTSGGNPKSVLLLATARKHVDAINTLCDAARLSPLMVTSSAVALGLMTGRSAGAKNPLVLLVSSNGAELTAQSGESSNAIRHMRGPGPDRSFVGELRRAISGMPPALGAVNGSPRELVVWDAAGTSELNSTALGGSLGMPVRSFDLPALGLDTSQAASNGEGRKYAAAVSLGMLGLTEAAPPVDFLHSRLAPPKPPIVPRWVITASLAGVAVLALVLWAFSYMQGKQSLLDRATAENDKNATRVKEAKAQVEQVSFAQAWHIGSPRYLACLTDLTNCMPEDQQTYATSLSIHEVIPPAGAGAPGSASHLPVVSKQLSGVLEGKTTEQRRVLQLLNAMKTKNKVFPDVKLQDSRDQGTKTHEVSFVIQFTYVPSKMP